MTSFRRRPQRNSPRTHSNDNSPSSTTRSARWNVRPEEATMQTIAEVAARFGALRQELDRVIIGQDRVKTLAIASLVAGGHMLLEGAPGTGKTLLSLALARLLGCRFRRVQFTPDLMPADLLGAN